MIGSALVVPGGQIPDGEDARFLGRRPLHEPELPFQFDAPWAMT